MSLLTYKNADVGYMKHMRSCSSKFLLAGFLIMEYGV